VLSGPTILLSQLKTLVYSQFSIYDLSVLPMFVLMGNIASRSGLSRDLFRAANAWLGWMRGGVAIAAIAACAGFGAVCGSSLATASTMGQVALPELRRYRYSPELATGTLAAGGVLGILIPPSVVLVVYAIVVEASIVEMFIAAFIPGLIAVARRSMNLAGMKEALLDTARTSGMIYLILLGAQLLNIFMARGGVPQAAAQLMAGSGLPPMTILVLLLVALIVLGCLMDSLSMILLAMPFFWPVIAGLDFGMSPNDLKVWFGIIALIVVELGLITPPVGMNVFVINSLARDVPMSRTFLGVMPFFVAELFRVALIVAFPALSLWLPHLLAR